MELQIKEFDKFPSGKYVLNLYLGQREACPDLEEALYINSKIKIIDAIETNVLDGSPKQWKRNYKKCYPALLSWTTKIGEKKYAEITVV